MTTATVSAPAIRRPSPGERCGGCDRELHFAAYRIDTAAEWICGWCLNAIEPEDEAHHDRE